MTRILFYLPVVTPWWFDHIVAPMIRSMSAEAEIHVLVPRIWRGTGIGEYQLAGDGFEDVRWHIVEGPSHPSLRTCPDDRQGVIDFVAQIDPDYSFCRSADAETPLAFPGKVRFLMESGAPPLPGIDRTFILQDELFHQGHMPALSAADRERVVELFGPTWKRFRNRFETKQPFRTPRDRTLAEMGLPTDRRIIAVPLEYAHEENFFNLQQSYPDPVELIGMLAEKIADDEVLAVTDHPLNYLYADNSAAYRLIDSLGARAHLVPNSTGSRQVTNRLARHCDAMIVQNSKSIYSAAYFGKPILRLSTCRTAEWMNVRTDLDGFLDALRSGTASGAADADALLWFGAHIMHEILDPLRLSPAQILERFDDGFDAGRLQSGLDRFEHIERLHVAAAA